ncbi:hypothetical protein ILUMI_06419 [Ignelater luminosus]|uniref:Uncharacterized protein n=1 Tax=Ignelater luminosus TaxID=2038154 RepID=A0A8K0D5B1_IGNLU|nr:hypothetical protein ILUMI_06419 [Ignelater luminosus]
MSHRYSSAFSHLILAGTGIYCLVQYHGDSFKFPCISYGVIITNSLLGVWRWGNPDHGHKVEKPYNFTGFLQNIISLPFIVTQVWLAYNYQKELAYLHSLVSVLPLTLYLADRSKDDLVDLIIAANCVSLGVVSFLHENYYGISAAISYMINHFWLREGNFDIEDVPVLDLFNYGLCFFCYFALRTLQGGK